MIDKYNEAGISTLERTGNATAKPASKCIYPRCEECDKYHVNYCTVPMVVSKQDFIIINDKINDLMKRVLDLETLVDDEILGSDKGITIPPETKLNYTWADYFKEQE